MAELPSLAPYEVFFGVVLFMLLLASASPARRRLLEQAAIPHRVRVSGVDEALIQHEDPAQLVQLLAQAKAKAVFDGLDREHDAALDADGRARRCFVDWPLLAEPRGFQSTSLCSDWSSLCCA